MRHKSKFTFLLLLAVLFVQTARTQGTDVIPFQEQTEELLGAILMVENKVLFMERNAIPYSFTVTSDTRITVGSHPANLEDLEVRKGHPVTVKFLVTRNGNIAQEIAVGHGMRFPWMGRGMGRGMMHGMLGMPATCPMWPGTS
jgi:hypothetical protein